MKMNRTPRIVALVAIITTLAAGMSALAQRPGGGGPPGGGGRGPGGGGGGMMGGFGGGRGGGMRMYENLGLKPDQKTKIEGLVKKHREAMQALRKKQNDEIKALLTPEQRAKLDKQMEEMRSRFGGMMGGPGGGGRGPGGPPPGAGGGR